MKKVVLSLGRRLLAPVLLLLGTGSMQGQVLLNELMADNRSTLANEGTFPDWVEIVNTNSVTVNLAGWGLSDDLGSPSKFVFPPGTELGPGGMLLVFLDDEFGLPGFHAGFGLDSTGELLALYSPSSPFSPVDLISFGLQLPDYSIGRFPAFTGTWVLTSPTPAEMNAAAPLGSPDNLFLNEWMASPTSGPDWLELFNQADAPVSLGGLVFTDDPPPSIPSNRAVPLLSFIGPDGFLQLFADDLAEPGAEHLDFKISAGGETLTLYQSDRVTVVDQVVFGGQSSGVSQGRLPDGDPNLVFFTDGRQTPGASNFLPLTNVVINEVLSHTDLPLEDAIELRNVTGVPVDLSYWWLSDSRSEPRKYRIPFGRSLAPFGFTVFYEGDFNPGGQGVSPDFSLNSAQGDDVVLSTGDFSGRLTGFQVRQRFGAADNAVSLGRYENSQGKVSFVALSERTFGVDDPLSVEQFRTGTGLPNAAPLVGPLVINEIMYHPPDFPDGEDNSLDEYLEILNLSEVPVNLFDVQFPTNTWRIEGGVNYTFPQFQSLGAGEALLVVNFDPNADLAQLESFRNKYNVAASVTMLGPYSRKLGNGGENLELFKPDTPQGPGQDDEGFVPYLLADRIDYEDRDPWPEGPDGSGLALQRRQPEAYGDDPANWMGSVPSPGTVLVRIDHFQRSGGDIVLRFRKIAGRTYAVQVRERFTEGNWVTAESYLAGLTTEVQEFTESLLPGEVSRFYRVITPATP